MSEWQYDWIEFGGKRIECTGIQFELWDVGRLAERISEVGGVWIHRAHVGDDGVITIDVSNNPGPLTDEQKNRILLCLSEMAPRAEHGFRIAVYDVSAEVAERRARQDAGWEAHGGSRI